jgi:hypothetical protein
VLSAGDFTAARFLLKPGRTYEQAVESFSPYNMTKEVNTEARDAAGSIIRARIAAAESTRVRPSYLLVNNRLEGSALNTIRAILGV